MEKLTNFIRNNFPSLLLVLFIIVLIGFIAWLFRGKMFNFGKPTVPVAYQQPFHVIKTSPADGAKDVFPATEKRISFTTDVPIVASSSFSLTFSPPLASFIVATSKYPTKEIITIGSLGIARTYTVKIRDQQRKTDVYSWSFSTSPAPI